MRNLENVAGLQEMSLQEMEEVNGGIIGLVCASVHLWVISKIVEACMGKLAETLR